MMKMLVRSAAFVFIFISVNSEIEYPEEEYCPVVNNCRTPLLYNVHYRCASDKSCRPHGYKCCRSDCYIHKVCVVPVNKNGEKIQLPDDILKASTYVITEPTAEISTFEFTTAHHNITEELFSTINTSDAEITVDVTDSTDAITGSTEFFNQSSSNTEPIALTESPIENITEILIPTGKEWEFEASGDFGDEKDKLSTTTTLLSTENLDDIDGSGDDQGIIVFPDDDRIKNFTTTPDDDFSFDNSVTVRDMDVDDGSGSGIGDSDDDDFDEGVKIEKMWEGSGLDVIDNEPDDVDEILTTYFPQIDDLSTTSKISIGINETHLNTTITDVIDIDYSYGSTLEELNSTLTSTAYENATLALQWNTTVPDLLNVSTPNPLAEEHQTDTVTVEAINGTTVTNLTVEESALTYSSEETTAIALNTSLSDITIYAEVTTTTPLNETSTEDRNYFLQNITTNELKTENLGSTINVSTENLNSSTIDTEISTINSTTTKSFTNEIVEESSGDEFPDSESDDLDEEEEITTYVPISLNKNYIRTKPNITFTLAPDDDLGVTIVEDGDGDYDDNEVDEDIRNNFQTRITSG